uniref:RING-type domain-containing protein n=1 Tax=Acrobeloides nanus TaxID=290746 RepID=A0A914D6A8_9BILA
MCDMDATDIEIYKQHIAGRKHKRMLVEDKFTGNNILKDICGYEECCEDLKKACAACGNTIWWGQCGHAMHQNLKFSIYKILFWCCAKEQLARDVNCPVCNEPWQLEKRTRALKL